MRKMTTHKLSDAELGWVKKGGHRSRESRADKPQVTGYCNWCQSPVSNGRLFCSKRCSDAHYEDKG